MSSIITGATAFSQILAYSGASRGMLELVIGFGFSRHPGKAEKRKVDKIGGQSHEKQKLSHIGQPAHSTGSDSMKSVLREEGSRIHNR